MSFSFVTGVIFRPSGLSAIYLFVMFYLPFVPTPNEESMPGCAGIFFKVLIAISVLTSLCQITFQLLVVFLPGFLEVSRNEASSIITLASMFVVLCFLTFND